MNDKKDYYEVLGVSKTALDDEIKSAYRKKALANHPDRCIGDAEAEARFKEIQEAYEVLSDTDKRHNYDRYGHQNPFRQQSARNPHDIFNDFFSGMFTQGAYSATPTSRDLQLEVELEFLDAALGCTKHVSFERSEFCIPCQGTGAKDGNSFETCKLCNGSGRITQNHGFVKLQSACHQCRGRGKVIIDRCPQCNGDGFTRQVVELDVKIPEGAFERMRLSVKGQGEILAAGAMRGDLHLLIRIKKHAFFERDEEDLLCTVPITFSTAIKGGIIVVPGLTGTVEVLVPAGIQSGSTLRVANQGIVDAYYPTRRGNMLVKIEIETPKDIPAEYSDIIDKLAEMEVKHPGEKITNFEKMKDEK